MNRNTHARVIFSSPHTEKNNLTHSKVFETITALKNLKQTATLAYHRKLKVKL
jgi:hypothetical protein